MTPTLQVWFPAIESRGTVICQCCSACSGPSEYKEHVAAQLPNEAHHGVLVLAILFTDLHIRLFLALNLTVDVLDEVERRKVLIFDGHKHLHQPIDIVNVGHLLQQVCREHWKLVL